MTRGKGNPEIVTFSADLEKWLRNDSSLAGNSSLLKLQKKHISQWFADFAYNSLQNCIAIQIEELPLLAPNYTYNDTVPNATVSFKHRGKAGEAWYKAVIILSSGWDNYFDFNTANGNVDYEKVTWESESERYPGTKKS